MLKDEIQAYLDGLNTRENVLTPEGKRIPMFSELRFEVALGVYLYTYDGLAVEAIRPMDGDRVLVYEDCDADGNSDHVKDCTLAEHFRDLTLWIFEQQLYSAQDEQAHSCGARVTNSGWSVDAGEDYIEICSKTDIGKLTSRYVYSTKETTHEWH